MKKIKILQIIPNLNRTNGVNSYICNYFTNMDNDNIDWSFAVLNNEKNDRYDEIIDNGGHIFELYRIKNVFKYMKLIDEFFEKNKFDIVHCNVANIGLIFLYYAKKHNVPVRIIHSHGTMSGETFSHKLRNDLIIPFSVHYANTYFACSQEAGRKMFKKKSFKVINNAIDYKKYVFNKTIRKNIREKYNLDDSIVIGNVGRLSPQKNQEFLIKAFSKAYKQNKKLKLIILGDGVLLEKYKQLINKLNLNDCVILFGSVDNADEFYSAMDKFVLPSNFEGLPVVGIEAQVNGLECIFSNKITNEVDINKKSVFLPINSKKSIDIWQKELQKTSIRSKTSRYEDDYEIKKCSCKLKKIYENLVKEK